MDRKLFEKESQVLLRSIEFAKRMDELHIIIFAKKGVFQNQKVGNNLFLYPTNSTSRFFYIWDAIKIGKKIITENKLIPENSVLLTQDPSETGYVGYKLKKIFGFPLQVQIHTDFFSSHFKSSILNRIRVLLIKVVLPKADGIRVVADFLQDSIRKSFPRIKAKVDTLPVFVDIEKIINTTPTIDLNHEFPKFKFIILIASRLTKEKRVDIALRAFKNVLLKFPHAGLVIAGSGEEKRNLENLVIDLGLDNNVVFVGWHNNLVSLYKTSDLFLVTSEYEGYGMTLIEAGASGCPIVTTKVGIAKSNLFQNEINSLVCSEFDEGCISKDILEMISNNSKRELFKHRMQDNIKSLAMPLEEYADKYVSLLKKLNV